MAIPAAAAAGGTVARGAGAAATRQAAGTRTAAAGRASSGRAPATTAGTRAGGAPPASAPAPEPPAKPSRLPGPAGKSATKAKATRRRVTRPLRGAARAGGNVLLGTLAYVLALTYMRGGAPAVKQLLAAKFLNRTPLDIQGTGSERIG
ncbi:hypothetical protein [Occultella kanbiaonis]|uniref:hypothetical protein n=1 Tax=Occultella kanbiaonis TaxID=2675754 RepID=UPI0012BA0075|nr:hypothetical protein [Occultella kanbiaonis]